MSTAIRKSLICCVSFSRIGKTTSAISSSCFRPIQQQVLLIQGQRGILSDAVQQRINSMVDRHKEVVKLLNDPDNKDYSKLGKELSSLASVVSLQEKVSALAEEEKSVKQLLQEAQNDEEMESECRQDLNRIESERADLEQRMMDAVLPTDEDDDSDAILEIRAGTGGDEAALFAGELLDTYTKTAQSMKWRVDILDASRTDLGGVREAAISVTGRPTNAYSTDTAAEEVGPYGFFKFESGVHRVQRVPINDTKLQTSACSIAVLPSIPEDADESLLPMSELRIETMRASGAGGQHVNTTDSAVRITHMPTGIQASIQDERSQHKNKEKALKLVAARVREQLKTQEEKARGETRTSLMGGGDRSERIRTYNFPQDRVTDHRCKHSAHGIDKMLQGGLDGGLVSTFFPIMRAEYKEELLKTLETLGPRE